LRNQLTKAARLALEFAARPTTDPEHWRPSKWVSTLKEVPDLIAQAIMKPLDLGSESAQRDQDHAHRAQLAFLRELGKLDETQLRCAMRDLLEADNKQLLTSLAVELARAISELAGSEAATGEELHNKFVSAEIPDMSYGKLSSFFDGLEGLIGSPNPKLQEAMAHEHCSGPDAIHKFTTKNYSITTCPPWEWYFVVDPDTGRAEILPPNTDWPSETYPAPVNPTGQIRRYRQALSPAAFERVLREKNQKLDSVGAKKLQSIEFVASRLYTGPMFMKYNTALRACGKDPRFIESFKRLNHGNKYTTTLHVINSAIVKLGKITAQSKVYRGISGRTLPKDFMDPARTEPRGGIELGFMSTTHDKEVAVHYAQKQGVVFEISMGLIDRGADVSWLSQYPHERELLFSPLTGCEITELSVEGSFLVAKVRLSVNLTTPTIEQVMAKMQSANLQLLDNIRANVVQANPPPRVLLALDGLRGVQAARDPSNFNEAGNFRAATSDALSEQDEAFTVLADEDVWEEVAKEMDDSEEEAFESLSMRMWSAALVSAHSGQHAAAIRLLRLSRRRSLDEERAALRRDQVSPTSPELNVGQKRHTRMVRRIANLVSEGGVDKETFIKMASEVRPSLVNRQASMIFEESNLGEDGKLDAATARSLLEQLSQQDAGSRLDALQRKGSKPLFATRSGLENTEFAAALLKEDSFFCPATPSQVEIALREALKGASLEAQREDLRLLARLLQLGAPSPWPATICHLVKEIDCACESAVGTQMVERITKAFWADRMAIGEEVFVLQNNSCNLWKTATIQAITQDADGTGPWYDIAFARGMGGAMNAMPANHVLPVGESGAGALLRAATNDGNVSLVRALLRAGVHVYEASEDGNTALHLAATHGYDAVYKVLMDKAATFPQRKGPPAHAFTKNVRGMRAFDYMVQGHHIRCTRLMRPSSQYSNIARALEELDELPGLLRAACNGTADDVKCALRDRRVKRQHVDAFTTTTGMTALMLASYKGPETSRSDSEGTEEKVRALLEAKADVNKQAEGGCVALTFAAESGHSRVATMLLDAKAKVDVETQNGMTPLLLACQIGCHKTAEILIDWRADVDRVQKGGDEFPPIIYAAMNGHTSCVDVLIQRKANVNYAKADGFSALILAAGFNQLVVVRRLVRAGAKVEHSNIKGHTALLHACNAGQGAVVRALLQLGANPKRAGNDGYSALHLACKGGHADVVSALLSALCAPSHTFDINAATPDGQSALHLACTNGNDQVVRLLIEPPHGERQGAEQRMRDARGRDAYAIAKDAGHVHICQLLQPTREQMSSAFSTMCTVDAFMRARTSLTLENVNALKRELAATGVLDGDKLATAPAGPDPVPTWFARVASGDAGLDQDEVLMNENKGLKNSHAFALTRWAPDCTRVAQFASSGVNTSILTSVSPILGLLGGSRLPTRHRFLVLRDRTWHKFNVLVLGKSGGRNDLMEAIALLEEMKAEAIDFAARSGWSNTIGLYFEVYPHASADALYLHVIDEIDPETDAAVELPGEYQGRLLRLDDVLSVLKDEREVEGAEWAESADSEEWMVRVVCISPIARNRGNLTVACMREVFAKYPKVIHALEVCYDDRDQDRRVYAPAFHFRDIPRPARENSDWSTAKYDYVLAIGGMSPQQGNSLRHTLSTSRCPFGVNGTPGFNIGFGEAAEELTDYLQASAGDGDGIVENATAALVITLEEHQTYMNLLPRSAQLAAKQSRVAFPLTARGHTKEGAGSYGRQFRDKDDQPTIRNRHWFSELADRYAAELGWSNRGAAKNLEKLSKELLEVDLQWMVSNGEVIGDLNELGAILKVCDQFVKPEVVAAMHSSAERLYPILVKCDEAVGVTQSKIYDAKLVLSLVVKRVIDAGLLLSGVPATYSDFGLEEPTRCGMMLVAERELVRDLIFVLMSLHRPSGGLYMPCSDSLRSRVRNLLKLLARLPVLRAGLMLCDTGVDPNEDDLAAIMMVVNLNLLANGQLMQSLRELGCTTEEVDELESAMEKPQGVGSGTACGRAANAALHVWSGVAPKRLLIPQQKCRDGNGGGPKQVGSVMMSRAAHASSAQKSGSGSTPSNARKSSTMAA